MVDDDAEGSPPGPRGSPVIERPIADLAEHLPGYFSARRAMIWSLSADEDASTPNVSQSPGTLTNMIRTDIKMVDQAATDP